MDECTLNDLPTEMLRHLNFGGGRGGQYVYSSSLRGKYYFFYTVVCRQRRLVCVK